MAMHYRILINKARGSFNAETSFWELNTLEFASE